MICSACNKSINCEKFLQCCQCRLQYHCLCLNITNEQFHTLSDKHRSNWQCPACNNITRRSRVRMNTPPHSDISMNMSFEHPSSPPRTPENLLPNIHNAVTMENISSLLDIKLKNSMTALMEELRSIIRNEVKKHVQSEIASIINTLKDEFTNTTDFICADVADLKSTMSNHLQTVKTLDAEKAALQKEINTLNNRLSAIERMSRSQNVEIQAVPENRNENIPKLVKNLCEIVNAPIDDNNILSCRRVAKMNPNSNRPRNILVTLSSSRLRDQILSACRRFNKAHKEDSLNTTHLGLTTNKCNIYVTEHLSPECKSLHAAARQRAKEINFKYVWVKYGRVYMRKTDRDDHIYVKNVDILNKLK